MHEYAVGRPRPDGQKVRLKRGIGLFGKERGPFRFSIQAISASETGHFRTRNGLFRRLKWPVLQLVENQVVMRVAQMCSKNEQCQCSAAGSDVV